MSAAVRATRNEAGSVEQAPDLTGFTDGITAPIGHGSGRTRFPCRQRRELVRS